MSTCIFPLATSSPRLPATSRAYFCFAALCAQGRTAASSPWKPRGCSSSFGAETKIYDPHGLPLPDDAPETHPKVQELRNLATWSDGQVWCSPERHGAMSGVMKSLIDWIPLSAGAIRPTQGKTLAVMQVTDNARLLARRGHGTAVRIG